MENKKILIEKLEQYVFLKTFEYIIENSYEGFVRFDSQMFFDNEDRLDDIIDIIRDSNYRYIKAKSDQEIVDFFFDNIDFEKINMYMNDVHKDMKSRRIYSEAY